MSKNIATGKEESIESTEAETENGRCLSETWSVQELLKEGEDAEIENGSCSSETLPVQELVEEEEEAETEIEICQFQKKRKEIGRCPVAIFSVAKLVKEIRSELDVLSSHRVAPNYCIFRIPAKLRKENEAPYLPQYARIGPLLHCNSVPRHKEEEKKRYLDLFLRLASDHQGTRLEDFVGLIERSLTKIRGCYEKTYYRYSDNEKGKIRQNKPVSASQYSSLGKMILVDAGFILGLFLSAYDSRKWSVENDVIFAKSGTIHDIKQDLMLLQNQLPFFLLRDMYELAFSGNSNFPTFLQLACHFFSHYYNQNISIQDVLSPNNPHPEYRSKLEEAKHFTDLVRTFQLPYSFKKHSNNKESRCWKWIVGVKHGFMDRIARKHKENEPAEEILDEEKMQGDTDLVGTFQLPYSFWKHSNNISQKPKENEGMTQGDYLYSAVLLLEAGVKLKVSLGGCLFEIDFDHGVLLIPPLRVDNSTESFFGNLMVWEQCYYPNDTFICDYLLLMQYLIKSVKDVDLLVRKRIIINQLGSPEAIVNLFNRLRKHIRVENNRYSGIYMQLNKYNATPHHGWIAILKQQYFSTPWKGVATIAAAILLVLTLIQTICAAISL